MLSITVQVTKTPQYLEQIAHMTIHNTGQAVHGRYVRYDVYLDGEQLEYVYHYPENGWATLVAKAITENGLATQQREEKSTGAGYKLDYE